MSENSYSISVDSKSVGFIPSYSPLALYYKSPDGARSWGLKFQQRPTADIHFVGDLPTQAEIIESLALSGMPIVMVQVVEVICRYLVAQRAS